MLKRVCMLAISSLVVLSAGCDKDDELANNKAGSAELLSSLNTMVEASKSLKLSADPDNDFALLSSIHTETILKIAEQEIKFGNSERMKNIAADLLKNRNTDLSSFSSFLNIHLPHINLPEPGKQMLSNLEKAQKNIQSADVAGDVDKVFATMLLNLNQASVDNAQLQLSKGDAILMKTMSGKIKDQQGLEINYLNAWLIGNKNAD